MLASLGSVGRVGRMGLSGRAALIGRPSLTLDFMTPGSLDSRITFSRASTATYTDASGTIQTAAINAPRWDYAGGVLRGVLVEEARTNLLLNSGDVSVATNWVKTSFSGPAAPIVTANQATAPDGTLTAASITYPSVSAGGGCIVYQTFVATANPYAVSVWLRGAVGGEQVYLMATPNDGATYYRATAVLTTAWQRLVIATPALTAVSWFVMIGTDLRDAGQSAKPAQTIYAWGAQAEQGTFTTSYIPTVLSTVTRAMDICSMLSSPWFTPSAYSLAFEFDAPDVTRVIGGISDAAFGANTSYFSNSQYYCGATLTGVPAITVGVVNKQCAVSTGGGAAKLSNNGGVPGTGSGASTQSGATRLAMGNDPWSLTTAFCGHMRRVQYWPRVLSDAEMQAITA